MLIAGRYTIVVRRLILMKSGEKRFLGTRCAFTRVAKSVYKIVNAVSVLAFCGGVVGCATKGTVNTRIGCG